MKRLIWIFAAISLLCATNLNAQTAIETPKILDNVYLGVGGGVTTPMSWNSAFPVNSNFAVRLGKDISPVFGVNVEGMFNLGDNIGWHHTDCFSNTFIKSINVGVNSTVNWMNLCGGYKGAPRVFEVSTVFGLGWGHMISNGKLHHDDLTSKTAINLAFNLGHKKAWQIYLEPMVLWNLTNRDAKVEYNKMFAQMGLSAGIIYKFKTSNDTHNFKTWNVGSLLEQIQALLEENEALRNTEPIVETQTIIKEMDYESTIVVTFEQNSDELTNEAIIELTGIKEGSTVGIIGTASPEGTYKRNSELTRSRAQKVADFLIHERNCEVIDVRGDDAGRTAIVKVIK